MTGLPCLLLPCCSIQKWALNIVSSSAQQQWPANFMWQSLIVVLKLGRLTYNCSFVTCWLQCTFRAKCSICIYVPSRCDSWVFDRVQDSAPYSRILSVTALKNCIFRLLGRLDFQMLFSLCSAGQVFALCDTISLDVVLIHESRHSKLVTHSRFFPSRLLRLWIWLSCS